MPRFRRRGFTLIEILVVVTISAAIVMALSLLYRTTGRAAVALQTNQGDWSTEQFLRGQLRDLPMDRFSLAAFDGRRETLLFLTRRSALASHDGAPVVVRYRYDAARARLEYQERPAPAWWRDVPSADGRYSAILLFREFEGGKPVPTLLLQGVEDLSFAYRAAGRDARWTERWDDPKQMPALVRMQFRRGGKPVELVMEAGMRLSVPVMSGV